MDSKQARPEAALELADEAPALGGFEDKAGKCLLGEEELDEGLVGERSRGRRRRQESLRQVDRLEVRAEFVADGSHFRELKQRSDVER